MARSWHYPRWKRLALQFVLLLVLVLTLGLAEVVARRQRAAQVTVLGEPLAVGPISIRIPQRWVVETEDVKIGSAVIHVLEPDGNRRGRVLTIAAKYVPLGTTLDQFITLKQEFDQSAYPRHPWLPPELPTGQEAIRIANNPGRLIAMRITGLTPEGGRPTIWLAAALVNPWRIIEVQLECPDDTDADDDKRLILDVTRGISVPK
jgi:hypothetical protein